LGIWGGFKRRILTTLVGLIGLGIGTLIIGFTPASFLFVVVGAMLLVGFMQPITNGPLLAVLQAMVAPEMQGRVFTLISSLAAAMSPLGLVIAGPLSDAVGVRAWFIAGGILTGCMGVAGFLIPSILHIEDRPVPVMDDEVATPAVPPLTLPEVECD
jgi:DHA3 family macrolide efflux protein-like MFS transporter